MLPRGLLPKWLLLVAGASVFNTLQCFIDPHARLTALIYSEQSSQVTALTARLFGTWTLLAAAVRLYTAYNIGDKTAYDLTIATFVIALGHFGSEWLLFQTTSLKSPGLISPLVVACLPRNSVKVSKMHDQLNPTGYYRVFLQHFKKRQDGRQRMETRKISATTDCMESVDSSCLVRIGSTMMLCGISLELAVPYAQYPDSGMISTILSCHDASFNRVISGVDRCIGEVQPGHKSIRQSISGVRCVLRGDYGFAYTIAGLETTLCQTRKMVLAFEGANCVFKLRRRPFGCRPCFCRLINAAAIPGTAFNEDQGQIFIDDSLPKTALVWQSIPAAFTFAVFDEQWLADPTDWELKRCQGKLQFVHDSMSGDVMLCRKVGAQHMTDTQLLEMQKVAIKQR